MKHILFISPRLSSGGAERQMVTVARLLKKRGYDVDVLCYSYGDFYEDLLKKDGITICWKQHNYLMRLISCTWHIQKGGYDDVISFLPTPSFVNCFAAMIRKRWKVITGERSSIVKKPVTVRQKFISWLNRYADHIVCNSENAKRLWGECYPQYAGKLTTIYNIVKIENIKDNYSPKRDGRLHVCVAASVYDLKNPVGVVNALLLMKPEERSKIIIEWYGKSEVVIGDNREYNKVCGLINENKLDDCFQLYDATKEIANKMIEADVVALFSKLEGLPNAICEGMTLGKPILMSRVSDYNTLIEEGVNGFLCDWEDPQSIKNSLLKMADISGNELIKMGEISKQKAECLFSEETIINKWISLL